MPVPEIFGPCTAPSFLPLLLKPIATPPWLQIIGGSFVSTGQLGSKFARYQFRPHFFQHASFRVVAPGVDESQYDMQRYGPNNPIVSLIGFCLSWFGGVTWKRGSGNWARRIKGQGGD